MNCKYGVIWKNKWRSSRRTSTR